MLTGFLISAAPKGKYGALRLRLRTQRPTKFFHSMSSVRKGKISQALKSRTNSRICEPDGGKENISESLKSLRKQRGAILKRGLLKASPSGKKPRKREFVRRFVSSLNHNAPYFPFGAAEIKNPVSMRREHSGT